MEEKMLNKVKSRFSGKYIILLFLTLFIFTKTFASEYTVPRAAYSVYAEDLDLDGDKDIVVGHKYNTQTDWGGVSILENIGEGIFVFSDSLYFINGFAYVNGEYLDNNNYIDIFSQYVSNDPAPINNRFIGIVYNYGFQGFNNIIYFPLNTREPVHDITSGDIDNDSDIDIVVASHNGQFWGVLHNNGLGQYSLPGYTFVDYYHRKPPALIYIQEANMIKSLVTNKPRNEMTEQELRQITYLQKVNANLIKKRIGKQSRIKRLIEASEIQI